ncbi:MAG: hypothetical protein JXR78_09600 [Victivallales bacterium]|nr:hypothetical protein [Victivallales bacterium]
MRTGKVIFKKIFTGWVLVWLCVFTVFAAEPETAWHVAEAPYRIELSVDDPAAKGFADLSNMLVPEDVGNNIDVRNGAGAEIDFKYDPKTRGLLIAPDPDKTGKALVYYGMRMQGLVGRWSRDKYGDPPQIARLMMKAVHYKLNYLTREEWMRREKDRARKQFETRNKTASHNMRVHLYNLYMKRGGYDVLIFFDASVQRHLYQRRRELESKSKYPPAYAFLNSYELKKIKDSLARINARLAYNRKEIRRHIEGIRQAVRALENNERMTLKLLSRILERADDARELEIVNRFKARKLRLIMDVPVDKIDAECFPANRLKRNFATCFYGFLNVPHDGGYEFTISSPGSCLLKINDRFAIKMYGEHLESSPRTETVSLNLTRGLHFLELFFQKNQARSDVRLTWKKPEENSFSVLEAKDFAPAAEVYIEAIRGKNSELYPLVRRIHSSMLFTGKDEKYRFESLECMSEGIFEWEFNDEVFEGVATQFVMKEDASDLISLRNSGGEFASMELIPPPVSSNEDKDNFAPEISLNLYLPEAIYGDEELNMYVEVFSRLPFRVDALLRTTVKNGRMTGGSDGQEIISIKAQKDNPEERYKPASFHKKQVRLSGAELKNDFSVNYELSLPGLVFDRKTVRFLPLALCRGVEDSTNGLCAEDGTLVIPVLHRPTLQELREWSLAGMIGGKLRSADRVLVMTDPGTGLKEQMLRAVEKTGNQLEFYEWKPGKPLTYRAGLAAILNAAPVLECDTVLLIPSRYDARQGVAIRTQTRYIAAIIQALRGNPRIKRILLCTPVPPLHTAADVYDAELAEALRKLGREYAVDIINLNHFIRSRDNWRKAYENADGMASSFPMRDLLPITDFILNRLR